MMNFLDGNVEVVRGMKDRGRGGMRATLVGIHPHLWPQSKRGMKGREEAMRVKNEREKRKRLRREERKVMGNG